MKKWGPIVLTFVAGLLIGASVAWRMDFRRMDGRNMERRNERMVKLFSQKLDLTPEQREQVTKILDDKRQKMDAMHKDVRPKFEALRESTRAEIRAVLTPEQTAKFNELEAKRDARRKKRNGPPRP